MSISGERFSRVLKLKSYDAITEIIFPIALIAISRFMLNFPRVHEILSSPQMPRLKNGRKVHLVRHAEKFVFRRGEKGIPQPWTILP